MFKFMTALLAALCLASLALVTAGTPALAMGSTPALLEAEAAAEKVVPRDELNQLTAAATAVTQARLPVNSTAEERKASAAFSAKMVSALSAAGKARSALDRAGYDRNAAAVLGYRDKACAVLSGC